VPNGHALGSGHLICREIAAPPGREIPPDLQAKIVDTGTRQAEPRQGTWHAARGLVRQKPARFTPYG